MKKIAILMAAFNGEEWIEEQLHSIFSQKKVNVDVFVSLDLSSDKTEEILKNLSSKNHNLFILRCGERFGSAAKNFFRLINEVNVENYDFVAFSDQDDIWQPKKIIKGIEAIQTYKLDAYSSNVIAFWPNGKKQLIKKSYPQKKYDFMFESAGPGFTYIFKTKPFIVFQKFIRNNLDKIYNLEHDWLAYSFFRSKGYKWLIDKDYSNALYRQHNNNQYGANASFLGFFNRLKLIFDGWYFNQVNTISNVLKLPEVNIKFIVTNLLQIRRKKVHALSMLILFLLSKK
tara:strand:- start:299 stop:1156 length:858 start_codon:yes stop_codon:yes gene_type:complete